MVIKNRKHAYRFIAALGLGVISFQVAGETLGEALTSGKFSGDLLLRYEDVAQGGPLKDADALTFRSRLGYGTGSYKGWSLFTELESVLAAGDGYNSTVNGEVTHAVIADPEDTELNRLYLAYKNEQNGLTVGRQRIILDNARFVGNVGWRQNEQTFDALRWDNNSIKDIALTYSYINRAHRIFSDRHPSGNADMSSHLINASYTGLSFGKLTGYGYFLGFNDSPGKGLAKAAGTRTYGARFAGTTPLNDSSSVLYALEYASQDDYDDGASTNDADYQLAELGFNVDKASIKAGYEVLEGDGTYGFATPLATGHAFQGWADIFLGTPASGVEDAYLDLSGMVMGVKLQAVYHSFESDTGGIDYGDELDLLAAKTFSNGYSVGVKYADYKADSDVLNVGLPSTDAKKIWFWVGYQF